MTPAILPELFNSYIELHSAQLGGLIGLLAGLIYRDQPFMAYSLLFVGVVLAFVNAPNIGYAGAIDSKPWYFLTALYVTTVLNMGLVRYWGPITEGLRVFRPRSPKRDEATELDGFQSND